MSAVLKRVHIEKLWNYKTIDCLLNEDVNIV